MMQGAPSSVQGMLERDAFSRWLGVELLGAAPGGCTVRMRVRDDMVNGFGVAHGGIAFSLADSAMAFAANGGANVVVAVDNAVSYPAAIHVGDEITAVAREDGASRRLAYYSVAVRNQRDEVVALFRGTVYRTNRLHD
jgi:acyl-CoA thioesterase